jgi:asparagine synthase (glutamine-hydrolysing)
MPGIVGIVSRQRPDMEAVSQMVKTLVHEKFHQAAQSCFPEIGLAAGWVSDGAIDTVPLPAWNSAKTIGLIYAGESFSEEPSKTAESILGSYERESFGAFKRLNGYLSGILLDLRENRVILFNDPMGVSRIYWHQTADAFYFASEAKALLKVLPDTRSLDVRSVGEFFSTGCTLQNRSLFKGIGILPAASAWKISPAGVEKLSYIDQKELEAQEALTPEAYYEEFKSLWTRILPRYLRGPRASALSLTGGVDSRLILAWCNRNGTTHPAYTFGGPYRDCADVTVSRDLARIAKNPHQVIPIAEEFFGQFPELLEKTTYITDGVLDPTGTADLYVNRIARQLAPIRITGLNGGEILRRLIMFKPSPPELSVFASDLKQSIEEARETYARESDCHRLSFIAFKQSPWHIYSRLALERSQIVLRSPYFDRDLLNLAYRAPKQSLEIAPALRLIAEGTPAFQQLATDRASTLLQRPTTKIKRFVQEFTFKAEYAYDYGMPAWLALFDCATKGLHFERLFLGRHKFYHYRIWYRDKFGDTIAQVLNEEAHVGKYLREGVLRSIVKGHTLGYRNHTVLLHRLLTLETVHRTLLRPN